MYYVCVCFFFKSMIIAIKKYSHPFRCYMRLAVELSHFAKWTARSEIDGRFFTVYHGVALPRSLVYVSISYICCMYQGGHYPVQSKSNPNELRSIRSTISVPQCVYISLSTQSGSFRRLTYLCHNRKSN